MIFNLFKRRTRNIVSAAAQPNQQQRWPPGPSFSVPNVVFRSGVARAIGADGIALFAALCERATFYKRSQIEITDNALAEHSGLSVTTVRRARMKLDRTGLVKWSYGFQYERKYLIKHSCALSVSTQNRLSQTVGSTGKGEQHGSL